MYCLPRNAPVSSFSLTVANDDDLRKAYRIATVNLPANMMCLMNEETGELLFVNNGESPEKIDKYVLSLWKTFLFVPCETKFSFGE